MILKNEVHKYTLQPNRKKLVRHYASRSNFDLKISSPPPEMIKPETPEETERVLESRDMYRKELDCLYKNKSHLNPMLYKSLKYTVLPSIKLKQKAPDIESKRMILRSLFKNYYSNLGDSKYQKDLSLFHDHITRLRKSVYPYTLMPNFKLNNKRRSSKKLLYVMPRSFSIREKISIYPT